MGGRRDKTAFSPFISQPRRASLSFATRLSWKTAWRWTYFNMRRFQTPLSRNFRSNKAWKSAGDESGKWATDGSNNKKLIWFVNVCKYAFKLQLVTPLWADGVWRLPEQQKKRDISTANIFQLQLQMMSVERLHCVYVCVWHDDRGATQCVFACPLTCFALSHSTWLRFLASTVDLRVSLFSGRAGSSSWVQSNKEVLTSVCWSYLWSKEHSCHWSGHFLCNVSSF